MRPSGSPTLSVRAIAGEIAAAVPRRASAPSPARRSVTKLLSLVAAAAFGVLVALHGAEFVQALGRAFHAGWQLVALGALLEAASVGGYVLVLHRVVSSASPRLRLKDSYDITLAGTAATRLLPTAGLGGAAVTIWALHAHGVRRRELTERLLAFLVVLYGVYMAALLAAGVTVALGLVHVSRGRELGLLGAALAAAIGIGVIAVATLPKAARMLSRKSSEPNGLPVLQAALRRAWRKLRAAHPALLGAAAWWAFDVAVLVAMLHAFGAGVPLAAIVLAYFLGTMFNVLPLPGSLSGGLIGVLLALGAPAAPAIAAVLAYRTVAVWLPAACGVASLAGLRTSVARWRAEPPRL